jgi:2',3'-cyclic-nucleotide 2'-phosphodiesterase (5'-nucleotidase family)
MAEAARADVALVSHTTLGDGLPAGDVTRLDLDAFIRFDGPLHRARVDGRTLATILARANQDADMPLAARTGDFLYANPVLLVPDRSYELVTIGWVRLNASRYLGTDALSFAEVPELRLKSVATAAMPR